MIGSNVVVDKIVGHIPLMTPDGRVAAYATKHESGMLIMSSVCYPVDVAEPKYIIERPQCMPDWVQIGIKCRVWSDCEDKREGYLSAYDTEGTYRIKGIGRWYDHATYQCP